MIVSTLADFPKESIKEVCIQGKPYTISNIDGEFCAIDGRCAHAGGILSNGHLGEKKFLSVQSMMQNKMLLRERT